MSNSVHSLVTMSFEGAFDDLVRCVARDVCVTFAQNFLSGSSNILTNRIMLAHMQ